MNSLVAIRLLLAMAVATPFLALYAQDPAATDWAAEVERACTHNRYGVRLAAARKVAGGGAAAVPAIRAYAAARGRNALPAPLVDAIADAASVEPEVNDLLREWALDRDFYWRAQALRGLARRAPLLPAAATGLRAMFAAHHGDPAWLVRTHARFGSLLLGDRSVLEQQEDDPRARVRLAALAIGQRTTPLLQPLFDALADRRTFLGDPWGPRLGAEAHRALKDWLGDDHPLSGGGSYADQDTAIAALLAAAREKSGQQLTAPPAHEDPPEQAAGGIEVLSCKFGDLFLEWSAAGAVAAGLGRQPAAALPADQWREIEAARARLPLPAETGVLICDSLRLRWSDPDLHQKFAPHSLPRAVADWLQLLAGAIDEAGGSELAADLRQRLAQFAPRGP